MKKKTPHYVLVATVFTEREGGEWLTNGKYSRHEARDDAELHALLAQLAGPGISITVTDRENERDGEVEMHGTELTWFQDEEAA